MLRRDFIAGAATVPIIAKSSKAQAITDEDVRKASDQLIAILGRRRGGTWARSSDVAGDFILFRKISA